MITIFIFSIISLILTLAYFIYINIKQTNTSKELSKKINRIVNQTYLLKNVKKKDKPKHTSSIFKLSQERSKVNKYLIYTYLGVSALLGIIFFDLSIILTTTLIYIILTLGSNLIYKNKLAKMNKKFIADFPDVLELMARSILSGHSIPEAIKIISENTTGILSEEFSNIRNNMALGASLQDALQFAGKHIQISEFHYFVVITYVHQQTGGNIAVLLENLAKSLRKKITIEKKIKSLASEPVASATVIGLIPFVIITIITILNPQYMGTLVKTDLGHYIILGCVLWQILGVIVMSRIIKVEI